MRHGFPVPAGFLVTTSAYATLLADTGLGGELGRLLEAETPRHGSGRFLPKRPCRSASPRTSLRPTPLLGGGPVAVRSSATAEDLPDAAFAGQQDTFLNVVGEQAVFRAVVNCWASLWTDRAIAYRQRQRIDPREVAIAVVVQEMVPADTAGVLFSANPVTGERGEIVVDASPGLGEAVVSGRVTPDHYVLDSTGRARTFTPGAHEVVIRAAGRRGHGGERRRGQPAAGPRGTAVGGTGAAGTARPGPFRPAAGHGMGHRRRATVVLQARPMTALPPQPLRLNEFQRLVGPFFVEMFQDRPYPLDVSGWMQRGILAMLHGMAGSVGVNFPSVKELLPEEDGVVVRLVPPVPRPTLRTLGAPLSVARRARRFNPARWTQDSRFATFLENVRRLAGRDPRSLSWREVVGLAEDAFATMRGITELRISYLPGAFVPQLKLRLMLLLLGKRHLGPALIAGAETRTSQANRALEDLADRVRSHGGLARAFTELAPGELLSRVEHDPKFEDFRARLQAFLAEYGHRETVSVVMSSSPTWSDAPEVVLGLVTSMMGERRQAADQTGQALAELKRHPALRIAAVRRHLLTAVDAAKAGIAFREDSHFYATKVLPPLRRALAELGRRLCEAGVLADPADVHHLRFEELAGMDDGGALPAAERERYRRLVVARAAKRRELDGIPLLDTASLFPTRRRRPGALVSGMPASRGQATGTVRIIRGPAEFGQLRSGEILVCPYTNPSWTPLFQRAAAVVVDAGGIASHAAIVAREYGIPAVMGTGSGTSALQEGQLVLVDGTRGLVTAAAVEPPA